MTRMTFNSTETNMDRGWPKEMDLFGMHWILEAVIHDACSDRARYWTEKPIYAEHGNLKGGRLWLQREGEEIRLSYPVTVI